MLSQYRTLGAQGLAALAESYSEHHESPSWDIRLPGRNCSRDCARIAAPSGQTGGRQRRLAARSVADESAQIGSSAEDPRNHHPPRNNSRKPYIHLEFPIVNLHLSYFAGTSHFSPSYILGKSGKVSGKGVGKGSALEPRSGVRKKCPCVSRITVRSADHEKVAMESYFRWGCWRSWCLCREPFLVHRWTLRQPTGRSPGVVDGLIRVRRLPEPR